nr:unnamed protein product [Digitaria exilis]
MWMRIRSWKLITVLFSLMPRCVPPSPTKCLAHPATFFGPPTKGTPLGCFAGTSPCSPVTMLEVISCTSLVSSPTQKGYRDAWREGVGDAGGPGLVRSGLADPLHKVGVPGGAEADVVGEDGGVVDVVVAMMGIPSRVLSAAFCIAVTIFCHTDAVAFSDGTLPPPLSTLPAHYFSMTSVVALALSICDICPIFSSRVMRLSRSSTRSLIGCFGSLYLTYSAAVAGDARKTAATRRHANAAAVGEQAIVEEMN